MNEARDNAADDLTMLQRINTDLAIEAFRAEEQKRYQLDLKTYALTKTLRRGCDIDIDYYYEETEKIRAKYEKDRMIASALGRLPKEVT